MFAAAAPEQGLPPSADGSTDLAPIRTACLGAAELLLAAQV